MLRTSLPVLPGGLEQEGHWGEESLRGQGGDSYRTGVSAGQSQDPWVPVLVQQLQAVWLWTLTLFHPVSPLLVKFKESRTSRDFGENIE